MTIPVKSNYRIWGKPQGIGHKKFPRPVRYIFNFGLNQITVLDSLGQTCIKIYVGDQCSALENAPQIIVTRA